VGAVTVFGAAEAVRISLASIFLVLGLFSVVYGIKLTPEEHKAGEWVRGGWAWPISRLLPLRAARVFWVVVGLLEIGLFIVFLARIIRTS
jgi:hypothetical protein